MESQRVWRTGIMTGLLGAASVALWFFVLDFVDGTPLATPELLGRTLLGVLGKGVGFTPTANIAIYSLLHVSVFLGIGIVFSAVLNLSRRVPSVLAGLSLFVVVFQTGFQILPSVFEDVPGWASLTWLRIGAANLISLVVMGWYLWRSEPGIGLRFTKAIEGRS